jgi:hypothetical protein
MQGNSEIVTVIAKKKLIFHNSQLTVNIQLTATQLFNS